MPCAIMRHSRRRGATFFFGQADWPRPAQNSRLRPSSPATRGKGTFFLPVQALAIDSISVSEAPLGDTKTASPFTTQSGRSVQYSIRLCETRLPMPRHCAKLVLRKPLRVAAKLRGRRSLPSLHAPERRIRRLCEAGEVVAEAGGEEGLAGRNERHGLERVELNLITDLLA